ncbi:MAG: hypothetical protein AAF637_13300 [Pseudomonadota bacterium]
MHLVIMVFLAAVLICDAHDARSMTPWVLLAPGLAMISLVIHDLRVAVGSEKEAA